MNIEDYRDSPTGTVRKTLQGYWTFIPNPLPPALTYTPDLVALLSDADRALGTLAGLGRMLPNPNLLVVPYIRREAVLSSRIEGTQTALSDLFFFEASRIVPPRAPDVQEVINYVRAMTYGLERLRELPLSLRLVCEIHGQLMEGVRGQERTPGEFRRSQNWIGPPGCTLNDATYVPPPPQPEMWELLDNWEKFLHAPAPMPPLIQCAVMHHQFESIHPFLDGNGRVGRLLIILLLCERGHLPQPLLYLSAFFERHRDQYYEWLQVVRKRGDWDGWLRFFLRGVVTQSNDAVDCAQRILSVRETYRQRLQEARASTAALTLLDELFLNPYVTAQRTLERLRVSFLTAQNTIRRLEEAGIVREITGQQRNRVYCAIDLLRVIEGEATQT